jgi:hypothetical protein
MSAEFTTAEINDAWDRIARTSDGQIIYRHLQKLVMALSADVSALPVHEGGRILARNLMSLMAQGIVDSDRYAIAFPAGKPAGIAATRGAGRRITAEHFVPGYDVDRTGSTSETGFAGNTGTGTDRSGNGTGGTGST